MPIHASNRVKPPRTRNAVTHKFNVAGHEGYITVGLYDDGTPCEVFVKSHKEGSTVRGLLDMLGIAISFGLQDGVNVDELAKKFAGMRFEPAGVCEGSEIEYATSIGDYLGRWLNIRFGDGSLARVDPPKEEP